MTRILRDSVGLLPVIGILLLSTVAYGDGIHLQHVSLPELIDGSGVALEVRVDSYDAKRRALKATVKKVWSRKGTEAPASGKQASFVLPGEPQMVPGAWMVVRRYWGMPSSETAHKTGQQLVLIPSFADLKAPISAVIRRSPRLIYKLRVLFRNNWKATYRKRAAVADLVRDLADFDLYQQAYAILAARRRLRDAQLIGAASKAPFHDLVAYHLKHLSKPRQAAFLQRIVDQLKKRPRPRLEQAFVNHFRTNKFPGEQLGALNAFFEMALARSNAEDPALMYELNNPLLRHLKATKSAREAEQFIRYFARYTRLRPDYGGADEQILDFVKLLAPEARKAFCLELMGHLAPVKHGKFDHLGFTVILDNLDRIPAARMIRFLKWVQPQIDPQAFNGCDQVAKLVEAIVRFASGQPGLLTQLSPLARAVLPQYDCNVDQKLKARLVRIGSAGWQDTAKQPPDAESAGRKQGSPLLRGVPPCPREGRLDWVGLTRSQIRRCYGRPVDVSGQAWTYVFPNGCSYRKIRLRLRFRQNRVISASSKRYTTGQHCQSVR